MEITQDDLKDLETVRNYFGEHDKTTFEHRAYSILDSLLHKLVQLQKPNIGLGTQMIQWPCPNCNQDTLAMAWKKYTDEAPEQDGVFKCKMKDGTEKDLILYIESDWNENTLEDVYWYHWFKTEQDIKDWSPLEEEDEPEYWCDGKN